MVCVYLYKYTVHVTKAIYYFFKNIYVNLKCLRNERNKPVLLHETPWSFVFSYAIYSTYTVFVCGLMALGKILIKSAEYLQYRQYILQPRL